MQNSELLILAAFMVGIGIGGALARKNFLVVIMNIVTAGMGTLLAAARLGAILPPAEGQSEMHLFALSLVAVLFGVVALGCTIGYRRFVMSRTANVNEHNQLRH